MKKISLCSGDKFLNKTYDTLFDTNTVNIICTDPKSYLAKNNYICTYVQCSISKAIMNALPTKIDALCTIPK